MSEASCNIIATLWPRYGLARRLGSPFGKTSGALLVVAALVAFSQGNALSLPTIISQVPSRLPSDLVAVASRAEIQRTDDYLKLKQNRDLLSLEPEPRLNAIEQLIREAAQLTYWPTTQGNTLREERGELQVFLCRLYIARKVGSARDNGTKAKTACEKAIEESTKGTRLWFRATMFLGASYSKLAQQGDGDESGERAIAALQTALAGFPAEKDTAHWAVAQDFLGIAFQRRSIGNRAENLGQAINAHEQALRYFQPGTVDWVECLQNLGDAYMGRLAGDGAGDIEKAIASYQRSLTVLTPDNATAFWINANSKLGSLYAARVKGDASENRAKAQAALRSALTLVTREASKEEHLKLTALLGRLLISDRSWKAASEVLAQARQTFALLHESMWAYEPLVVDIARLAGTLFEDSAYAAAALGDIEHAIEYFNQGRGRILRTALNLRAESIPKETREEIDRWQVIIAFSAYSDERRSAQETSELVERVRKLLALASKGEATRTVKGAIVLKDTSLIPDNAAIIAPIISDIGTKTILISKSRGKVSTGVVDIPDMTTHKVRVLVKAWISSYAKLFEIDELAVVPIGSPEFKSSLSKQNQLWQEWLDGLEATNRSFGASMVAPALKGLRDLGLPNGSRLYWMLPGMGVSWMPLASAIDPATNGRLGDLYETVVIANLEELQSARAQAANAREPSIAVLANPTGDLPFAKVEGTLAASHFPKNARADVEAPLIHLALAGRSHWHFATHGNYAPDAVPRSGIVIGIGPGGQGIVMSVRSISQSFDRDSLPPRLIVLSACETGLAGDFFTGNNSDTEFAGLAGAFMAKGAGGVLSTLWRVDDRATTLLMAKFYDLLVGEKREPASALRGAQTWLRRATLRDLLAYIQDAADRGRIDKPNADRFRLSVQKGRSVNPRFVRSWADIQLTMPLAVAAPPTELDRPFEHPYYWAGFYYVGY
jgi:tetratricopeptide (TPR) repeat protein